MNKIFDINIGIFGTSNVGKSMFTNALIGKYCSEVSTNKKINIPQIYRESSVPNDKIDTIQIKNENTKANLFFDPNQIDKISPTLHDIGHIMHLHNDRARILIHDLPRLDDENSSSNYYWIEQQTYDMIVFIIDINSGLKGEQISVFKFLINLSKIKNCKIVCLINKCEDIYYDQDIDDLLFTNDLHERMFIESNNELAKIANHYLLDYSNKWYSAFLPISSKKYFIYQILGSSKTNDIQINHSGFYNVIGLMTELIQEKIDEKTKLLIKLDNEFISNSIVKLSEEIIDIEKYTDLIMKTFDVLSHVNLDTSTFYDKKYEIWDAIKKSTNKYLNKIEKINTNIVINDDYIDFEDFDLIHATLQQYCIDFKYLVDLIESVNSPTYFPRSLKTVFNKMFNVYDQLCSINISRTHVCPSNMMRYLTNIKKLRPDKFNHYAHKFLYFSMMCQNHYMHQCKDLIILVRFIKTNTNKFDSYKNYLTGFLSGRMSYFQKTNPKIYLFYLFRIQDMMENCKDSSTLLFSLQLESSINNVINAPYSIHGIDEIDTSIEEEIIKLLSN